MASDELQLVNIAKYLIVHKYLALVNWGSGL